MKLLVIGDSHANVFYRDLFKQNFPELKWDIFSVKGATISGLQNPNAKTQAKQQFVDRLGKEKWNRIILQIGEVDVGFVIWYRAKKYNVPVQQMIDKVLSGYESFMDLLLEHCNQLHALSIPLPTISDNNDWGEVANLRSSIKISQQVRTETTIEVNQQLSILCANKKVDFIDFDQQSLGTDGLVKSHLLRRNNTNHHYDFDIYAEMIAERLAKSFISMPI